MDHKIFSGFILASCFSLAGCNLTDDEKDKLDHAGNNLEKVALKPFIASPTNNDLIDGNIPIIVDLDPTITYKSVTLKIKGEEVETDTEAPFNFHWKPYFWSTDGESQVTLQVTAITEDDAYLRSDLLEVTLSQNLKNNINILTPINNSSLQNVDSTLAQWAPLEGAISYEYQLNTQESTSTIETSATLELPSPGNYDLKVRATNANGHTGAWTSPASFTLQKPTIPTIQTPIITKDNSGWNVYISWTSNHDITEIQIATDIAFTSVLDTSSTSESSLNTILPTGMYYARARTTNELGHISEWSQGKEIAAGLFAHKIDMNTYGGWDNSDNPIDFVLNEEDAVILASKSNFTDGSGDDFYVTKYGINDGQKEWGKSFNGHTSWPKAIAKKSDGFLLVGGSNSSHRNNTILGINESGSYQWKYDVTHSHNEIEETITYERVTDILELAVDQYAFLHSTSNYNITGEDNWGYTTEFTGSDLKIDLLDRSGGSNIINTNTISQPTSGSYDSLDKLLLSDSGLYAAGRYNSGSAGGDNSADDFEPQASTSGAYLLELDPTDTSIISQKTGGGVSNTSINSLIELQGGEKVVSYNNYNAGAATVFASNADSSDAKIDGATRYSKIASDGQGNYFMIGDRDSSNSKDVIINLYNASNQLILGPHTLNRTCFYDLNIQSIKYNPNYGLVILGTDGYSWSETHTVLFNMTDNFEYLCPTVK